jgi:hypothetical protein
MLFINSILSAISVGTERRLMRIFRSLRITSLLAFVAILSNLSVSGQGISTYADLNAALATGVVTNFASVAAISFSTSQETLQITKNTVIDGGTNNVIIDGSSATRLFVVHTNCQLILANVQLRHGLSGNGGAILNSGELIVSNCIFLDNAATNLDGENGIAATTTNAPDGGSGLNGGSIWGGAIYSYGPLYVYNSLFETNSATAGNGGHGGAGVSTTGQLAVGLGGNAGNGGNAFGGAIYSSGSNNVISGAEFLGNTCNAGDGGAGGASGTNPSDANFGGASGQGGIGGYAAGGAVYVTGVLAASNCMFAVNNALGGRTAAAAVAYNGGGFGNNIAANGGAGLGGGLFAAGPAEAVDLENCVFASNLSAGGGGGNDAASDSTSGSGGAARGGGIQVEGVAAVIRNCTLADNLLFPGTNGVDTGTNGLNGGSGAPTGREIYCVSGTARLANSILSGQSGSAAGVTDAGYNLCSDQSLAKLYPTTRLGISANLDSGLSAQGPPLGPVGIGGPAMLTLAVLAGPATNAIPGVPGITFPATDERLQARGTPATIGAFEVNTISVTKTAPATITTEPQNQIAVLGEPATLTVNATANPSDANPLGYQWQLNGVDLPDGNNFTGVNSPTLQIKTVVDADLGAYQVIVSPSMLDSVTNSAVAFLLVNIPTTIQTQPASKLNTPDGSVVTFKVKVSGSPPFYYEWRSNDVPLTDGNEFSGSATTNLTIDPATFSDAASYTVVITNFYRSVTSAVARLTVVADKAMPSVVISAPKANARTTTNAIYGTATDNAQVTNVNCWITNIVGGVTNVFFTDAVLSATGTTTKTWGITNALSAGTNIVALQSVDFSGNMSAVVSRKFFYVVPSPFSLSLNGPGNVIARPPFAGATPPTNGAILDLGEGYTLMADPNHDCLLTNWVSPDFTVSSNTLHFTMTPNLAIQANFVISPYLAVAGGYNGLFLETNGDFSPASAGMLSGLTVGNTGTYSGGLLLGAASYAVSGAFNVFGEASNYIARAAAKGGPIGLQMKLDWTSGQITGAVSGLSANWVSPLNAEENVAAADASSFESTLLLSPSASGIGETPPGYGYVLLTNRSGAVALTGGLPDGTTFSQSTPLGKLGHLPLYASLYSHAGVVIGWVTLTNSTPEAAEGLYWTRPSMKSGIYPGGFTNLLMAEGSPWSNSSDFSTSGTLTISNSSYVGIFQASISNGVLAKSDIALPVIEGPVNTKTGLVKITYRSAINVAYTLGYGAILQNAKALGGYFVTKTNAGIISLQP